MKQDKVFIINKKEGQTPFLALESFRKKRRIPKEAKMTYAGRLDPLASGLLPVLVGEEIKNKERYLNLEKEYEAEVLFGFSTDTYDVLGKVIGAKKAQFSKDELEEKVKLSLEHFIGKFSQEYPLYSSKTIKIARSGAKIKAPSHMVEVKSLKFFNTRKISSHILLKNLERRIGRVKGDFRQDKILKIWRKLLKDSEKKFSIASFYINCGGGFYVRQFAEDLGKEIGIPALAFSIRRTKVGKWTKEE